MTPSSVLALTELRRGDVLGGKYLLVDPLAVGGMGQVWSARNLATGAIVAAKALLPAHATSPACLSRFRQEAEATATLSHRAIVRVFDLIEIDPRRGSLVMVMELLRGHTLASRLQQLGPLSLEETLQVAEPLLSAVAHAHGLGIVHRDIKPDNVFLACEPDGQVMPKLVDFGISKLSRARSITLDGQTVGTPSYMSPEQTMGEPVDARSDIFSLGILLYECLAGVNPFTARFEATTNGHDYMAVFDVEPLPLAGVPLELSQVIGRALAKRPEDRFGSAQEMMEALRSAVPGLLAPDPRGSALPASPVVNVKEASTPATTAAPPAMRTRYRVGVGVAAALAAILVAFARPSGSHAAGTAVNAAAAASVNVAVAHHKQLAAEGDQVAVFDAPAESMERTDAHPTRAASRSGIEWIERSAWEERARQARRRLALSGNPGVVRDPGF